MKDHAKQRQPLSQAEFKVYDLIMDNPEIKYLELSKILGVTIGTVQSQIKEIARKGHLLSHYKTGATVGRFQIV